MLHLGLRHEIAPVVLDQRYSPAGLEQSLFPGTNGRAVGDLYCTVTNVHHGGDGRDENRHQTDKRMYRLYIFDLAHSFYVPSYLVHPLD